MNNNINVGVSHRINNRQNYILSNNGTLNNSLDYRAVSYSPQPLIRLGNS